MSGPLIGRDIPLHLWGVKLQTLKAGVVLPGVVSLDTGAWNGLFGQEHERRRASGMTEVEYTWRVLQPRYEQRVAAALHAPQQLPLYFAEEHHRTWFHLQRSSIRIADVLAQEEEEERVLMHDVMAPYTELC